MVLHKRLMWQNKTKPTLDAGCGYLPFQAKREGIGIDLQRGRCDVVGDIQHLPFRSEIFDKVYARNVLEHLDTPIEGFEKSIMNKLQKEVYGLSFELHSYILGYYSATALIEKLGKLGYKIQLMVRELDRFVPIIKFLGIRKALRLYESLVETRVFYEPSIEVIKNTIKEQRENPHIFAVRN